jgi:hypothetical protein
MHKCKKARCCRTLLHKNRGSLKEDFAASLLQWLKQRCNSRKNNFQRKQNIQIF